MTATTPATITLSDGTVAIARQMPTTPEWIEEAVAALQWMAAAPSALNHRTMDAVWETLQYDLNEGEYCALYIDDTEEGVPVLIWSDGSDDQYAHTL